MAKAVTLVASALCLLAVAGFAQCHDEVFTVEGKVYCDTCRVLFETRISEFLADAEVKLTCKSRDNATVTTTVTGKTDKDGYYTLPVSGDHEDDICDVTVVKSPNADCSEVSDEINSAVVSLTRNSGIKSKSRYTNPIGFVKKVTHPKCAEVLDELGFVPIVN